MERGMIQIYTGEGKGKTTAALGLALRAVGAGLRVYIAQFMKRGKYNEIKAIQRFNLEIKIEQFGEKRFIKEQATEQDKQSAQIGFDTVCKIVAEASYDLVILDELNVALHYKLIDESRVLDLFKSKPSKVELVLTGRYAAKNIIEQADLVTEMKPIKHYYRSGFNARMGIEK